MDLVRAGNDGAFEAIVARYRRGLTALLLGHPARRASRGRRAADLPPRLRRPARLRGRDEPAPWLYRIAHNQALNALRDRALSHEELDEGIDGVQRPDQAFEGRERLRDVVAAVSALPERQRDAIVLRELEGRSYDEIAAELGVTGGAVRASCSTAPAGTLRAGATALTPYGLMARLPWAAEGGEGMTARVAELCGAGRGRRGGRQGLRDGAGDRRGGGRRGELTRLGHLRQPRRPRLPARPGRSHRAPPAQRGRATPAVASDDDVARDDSGGRRRAGRRR